MRGPAGELYVDDGGSGGVAVLLIHGNGGDSSLWQEQLLHLRAGRRAVAIDLRGFGRSHAPSDGDFSIPALAGDVAAVVEELALERVVLAGHSIGGTVAIAASTLLPGRIAGLLLVDPTGDLTRLPHHTLRSWLDLFAPPAYEHNVEQYFRQMLCGCTAATEQRVLQMLHRTRRAAVLGVMETLASFDPIPPLTAFTGPKLSIVTALNDRPTSLHNLLEEKELPHLVVGGTSHWLMLDRPRELNLHLDRFLAMVAMTQTGERPRSTSPPR